MFSSLRPQIRKLNNFVSVLEYCFKLSKVKGHLSKYFSGSAIRPILFLHISISCQITVYPRSEMKLIAIATTFLSLCR